MRPTSTPLNELRLERDGAQLFPNVLGAGELNDLCSLVDAQSVGRAGVRLFNSPGLGRFVDASGALGAVAVSEMRGFPRPVRAILFDKTSETNWTLGWHQDRVIVVRERIEVDGFGPWTRKHGSFHVAPPFKVLAAMTTLRLHLDDVPPSNAPLLIAPGSHREGRVAEKDIGRLVEQYGIAKCVAHAGDVWLYATPILHASASASRPSRRRVLQVDYAVGELPGGLEWLGL